MYASTWGWCLPDWPNFTRPLRRDRWFLGACVVGVLLLTVDAFQGRAVDAVVVPFTTPLAAGYLRRLVTGVSERDRAYRARQRREAAGVLGPPPGR